MDSMLAITTFITALVAASNPTPNPPELDPNLPPEYLPHKTSDWQTHSALQHRILSGYKRDLRPVENATTVTEVDFRLYVTHLEQVVSELSTS